MKRRSHARRAYLVTKVVLWLGVAAGAGFLVSSGHAAAPAGRYTFASEGTVFDTKTKLTWQQNIEPSGRVWVDAKAYCSSLDLAGSGWRLPDMKELQTLIDESVIDPAIDSAAFPGTTGVSFWASTILAGEPTYAWFVNFYSGIAYSSMVSDTFRVRCVR